jgi:hypothetical protein
MKMIQCLLAIALVCVSAGVAKADPIDFRTGVLDPPSLPSVTYIDNDSTPFAVTFGACPIDVGADGCFDGYNESNVTFTSLDMSFANSTSSSDPTDLTDYLNGQTPTCETSEPGSLFSSASCSLSPDDTTYVLNFAGGTGIAPGTFFIITETGPAPSAFGTGMAEVASTPEPNSVLLLSTGMAMVGLVVLRRRGAAARISTL